MTIKKNESIPLEEITWDRKNKVLLLKAQNGQMYKIENPSITEVESRILGDESAMTVDIFDADYDRSEEVE